MYATSEICYFLTKKFKHSLLNIISIVLILSTTLYNQTLNAKNNELNILVIGGTGRVGSEIVKILAEDFKEITVMTRSKSPKKDLDNLDIRFVTADVLKKDQIASVFTEQKYDVVINAIAKVGKDENPHAIGQNNLNTWSKKTGVNHFILIGSVGAGNEQSHLVTDRAWSMWKDILQKKGIAEQSLMNSDIPYTVIRTGIIIYDDTPATGNAILSNNQDIVGLVTRKDLARLTVDCIMLTSCMNQVFHAVDATLSMD